MYWDSGIVIFSWLMNLDSTSVALQPEGGATGVVVQAKLEAPYLEVQLLRFLKQAIRAGKV